ncbi:MAG: hypothetical protein P1U63_07005 [Coxiellaceae bacterium]|nr:hypothetical protein [Coxiellaceae bacterium]
MTIEQVLAEVYKKLPTSLMREEQVHLLRHYAELSINPSNEAFRKLDTVLNHPSLQTHWLEQMKTYGVQPEPASVHASGRSNFQIYCAEWATEQYCKSGKLEKSYHNLALMMGRYRTLAYAVKHAANAVNQPGVTTPGVLLQGFGAARRACKMHGAVGYDLLAYMFYAASVSASRRGSVKAQYYLVGQQMVVLMIAAYKSGDLLDLLARSNAGLFNPDSRKQALNYSTPVKRSFYAKQAFKRLLFLQPLVPAPIVSAPVEIRVEAQPEQDSYLGFGSTTG